MLNAGNAMASSRQETMQPRQRKTKGRRKTAETTVIHEGKEKRTGRKTGKTGIDDAGLKKLLFSGLSIAVVVLAVAVGALWSSRKEATGVMDDKVYSFLSSFVCKDPDGYCHDGLVPSRRTQKAKWNIKPFELVAVVPRHLQIWDLDALRDDFVNRELMAARHAKTGNPLDGGAFLAAYVARRYNIAKQTGSDDHMLPYFDILPSYDEIAEYHPMFWAHNELGELLGRGSTAYALVKGYSDMIESEYRAFVSVSPLYFAKQVSEKDYKAMRIHVMSRSFGTGPPEPVEAGTEKSLVEEMQYYQTHAGVDLSQGCRAMVPILDSYDHHARPNVQWKYSNDRQGFRIGADQDGIPAGQELVDSYGTFTDPHLFAKFGFVNGDGSDYTQASIAVLHRILDVGMKQQFSYLPRNRTSDRLEAQKEELIRYLQFDDGYLECVQADAHPEAYELKRMKLDYLIQIANIPKFWMLHQPPRNPESGPAVSSNVPITTTPPAFDTRNLKHDVSRLLATCRLMSLTTNDVGEDFVVEMREMLKNNTDGENVKMLGPRTNELEYRAYGCLARLVTMAMSRYPRTLEEESELVIRLNQEAFQSRNWTAAHVRLGEMQTLHLIRGIGGAATREIGNTLKKEKGLQEQATVDGRHAPMFLRQKACPNEYSQSLLS